MGLNVGITTFHSLYNFGSVLQAFALQRTIRNLGNSCKIVNYIRSGRGTKHQMFNLPTNKTRVNHDIISLSTIRSQIKLRRRFSEFKQHLEMTDAYPTIDAIRDDQSQFNAFVTGSDMVWNPGWLGKPYAPVYYLDFVEKGRRIAYAPSFGVADIPPKHRGTIAGYLRRFDFLSAREDSGCRIIHDLIGQDVPQVLDPSLLQPACEYESVVSEPSIEEPYILLYPMQRSPDVCRMAMRVRDRLRRPLVAIVPVYQNPWRFRFADKVVFDAGPSEFLGWLKNAEFVCTNSFHGSAFSIIFRKNFLSSPAPSMNTRLHSLFERTGLLARQLKEMSELETDDWRDPVDYQSVEMRLHGAVEESMQYLRGALT